MKKELDELKTCPFCGGKAYIDSCDRIISIGCDVCKYHRSWRGLITDVPHEVQVNEREYYNPQGHEEAINAWNRRAQEVRDDD